MTPAAHEAAVRQAAIALMPSAWMVKPQTDVERHLRALSLEQARERLAAGAGR